MRLLTRADVLACGGGDIRAAMADVREALRCLRAGTAVMPPETSVPIGPPEARQARAYALLARVGDRAGVKWTAHAPPGAATLVHSLTAINDAASGLPLGVVESALLTATRTAAVSALALLARPPRRVALLGAGTQAAMHLHMLAQIFPRLKSVALWNRSPKRAARHDRGRPVALAGRRGAYHRRRAGRGRCRPDLHQRPATDPGRRRGAARPHRDPGRLSRGGVRRRSTGPTPSWSICGASSG